MRSRMLQSKAETSHTLVRAARVRREFGVHGEVAVSPLGGDVERFTPGLTLWLEDEDRSVKVQHARRGPHEDVVLSLNGLSSPEQAAALRGKYLCVDHSERRSLGDNEWFVDDLVGLRAVDRDGTEVGRVSSVDENPAHPMLILETKAGEQLIPFVEAFVDSVDIDRGVICVTPWKWEDES
jgi:16S rRNA processing protein RimM